MLSASSPATVRRPSCTRSWSAPMGDPGHNPRWKVVLRAQGGPDLVQSRLLLAGLEGVSWYRRRGALLVSVRVAAPTKEAAETSAVGMLGAAHVKATVLK